MNPMAQAVDKLLAAGYTIGEVQKKRVTCDGPEGQHHLYATHRVSDGEGGSGDICPTCVIALAESM